MCFVWIWEQTAIISLYRINLSVFITEAESVYCAVRTGSLNQRDTVSSLQVSAYGKLGISIFAWRSAVLAKILAQSDTDRIANLHVRSILDQTRASQVSITNLGVKTKEGRMCVRVAYKCGNVTWFSLPTDCVTSTLTLP